MNAEMISWLLALEVAAPFFVLSLVLIFILLASRKKYKEAARQLIEKAKNNEDNHKQELLAFLTKKLAISDENAKEQSKKIINERKFLLRNLISALLDKNTQGLVGLDDDLSRLSSHYHSLDMGEQVEAEVAQEEPPAEPEDNQADDNQQEKNQQIIIEQEETIKGQNKEIKSLKHEVHVTLTALNNIFAEFSSMFGEKVENKEMSVEQIITAMQAFSNKQATVAPEEMPQITATDAADTEQAEPAEKIESAEPAESADKTKPAEKAGSAEQSGEDIEEKSQNKSEAAEAAPQESSEQSAETTKKAEDTQKQSEAIDITSEEDLEDIDSVLDELELDSYPGDDEPSWDDAFEESGDKKPE